MSLRDAAVDLDLPGGAVTEGAIRTLRSEHAPDTALLTLYAIDGESFPEQAKDREALSAVTDVIGLGIVFPQPPLGTDDEIYYSADLSQVGAPSDGYVEVDDMEALEEQQA
jgi:hypothetical protein